MRPRFCVIILAFAANALFAADSATFNKDVLPIVQKSCQGCHRHGEAATFSLLTYESARPWAKASSETFNECAYVSSSCVRRSRIGSMTSAECPSASIAVRQVD